MSQNTYSERLELLRERLGVESLQDFVDHVNRNAAGEEVPYATARKYHHDNRRPSVVYLDRVARAFDVHAEWLLTGQGPALAADAIEESAHKEAEKAHEARLDRVRSALEGAFRVKSFSPLAVAAFMHAWGRMRSDSSIAFTAGDRLTVEDFARALAAPWAALEEALDWPDGLEVERYVMDHAVHLAESIRRRWAAAATSIHRDEPTTEEDE